MNLQVRLLLASLFVTGTCVLLMRHTQSEKPCSCEKVLPVVNKWSMPQFSKSVEPFLSAEHKLSEEAFSWWQHLQNEKRDFSTYIKTVEKLFQIVPSHNADLLEPSPDHYRRCAVVGNSGNLKGSRYGPLIDNHDVIMRMNTGPTEGFEADVGTRTTHRIVYPESALDCDNTTHFVLVPFKIQDLEWLMKALTTGFSGRLTFHGISNSSYAPVKSQIKANKDLVMVLNPAFMGYVHDMWLEKKGGYPSTGFMALVVALHICDEVHVFGYGADHDGNWSHYWEKLHNKNLKTGLHPGTQEYDIIQELAKQQKLKFYTGL